MSITGISNRGPITVLHFLRQDGIQLDALIDTDDWPLVRQHYWHTMLDRTTGNYYVDSAKVGLLHRFLTSAPSGLPVDHDNHNTLDNRRVNLKHSTPSKNQLNRAGAQRNNQLGIRGVYCRNGRYEARVKVRGIQYNLGTHSSASEASIAVERFVINSK